MTLEQYLQMHNAYITTRQRSLDQLKTITHCDFRSVHIDCSAIDEQYYESIAIHFRKNNLHRKQVLYYFEIVGGAGPEQIRQKIASMKMSPGKSSLALPRINNTEKARTSTILYVGKSNDILDRVKQHLGLATHSTYSMHLNKWAGELNLQLELYYMQHDFHADELFLLEEVENILHFGFNPLLGRSGH